MRENRGYPRATAVLPVRVTYKDRDVFINTEGSLNDFSNGGIGLILTNRLPTTLPTASLCVFLGPNQRPVKFDVRIIWLSPIPGDGTFRCGFQVLDVADEQLRQLNNAVWPNETFIKDCIHHVVEMIREPDTQELLIRFFINQVKSYITTIAAISEEARKGSITAETAQSRIDKISNNLVFSGHQLEKTVQDKLIALEIRKAFRLLLGPWIYQSRLMKHSFEKPRGYPGDYLLLERIYDNEPIAPNGSLAGYLDRYFLGNAYAESVRKRKDKTLELLRTCLDTSDSIVTGLNLACGSCREIRELMAQEDRYANKLRLTALDQDSDALNFSQQMLHSVAPRWSMHFIQEDILNLIREPEKFAKDLGRQDVIYSIGLADYLPDRVLKKLVKFSVELLRPRGRLILAHKDRERDEHAPLPPEWFCDWHFYERNEKRLGSLVREVTTYPITVEHEASGRIVFIMVTRPDT